MINTEYLEKIAKNITKVAKEDEEYQANATKGSLAGLGVGAAANTLAAGAILGQVRYGDKKVETKGPGEALNKAKELLRNAGYKHNIVDSIGPADVYDNKGKRISIPRTQAKDSQYFSNLMGGPHAISHDLGKATTVNVGSRNSTGIVAHELGHAISMNNGSGFHNKKFMNAGRLAGIAGMQLAPLGIVGTSAIKDKDLQNKVDKGLVAAGTLSMIPTIGQEVEASYRGAKLMKGQSLLKKMTAFQGIPSYLLGAAIPYMTYKGKQWLTNKDKESK